LGKPLSTGLAAGDKTSQYPRILTKQHQLLILGKTKLIPDLLQSFFNHTQAGLLAPVFGPCRSLDASLILPVCNGIL
jgi:hypothetical protein